MNRAARAASRRIGACAGPLYLSAIASGIGFVLYAAWLIRPGA